MFCKVGRSVFDVLYNLLQMLEIAFRIERVSGGLGGSEVRFVGGHGQHSFPKYRYRRIFVEKSRGFIKIKEHGA